MHVVVTGANGLVGSRLVHHLVSQGHRVTALGRGPQRLSGTGFSYVSVDLSEASALTACIEAAKPEVIVNPAGMADVDQCEREPEAAYAANVEGVATLCRAARAAGAHRVHVSTDYLFDGGAGPYGIDDVPNPRGTYALTKHLGEQTVRALAAPGRWTIARTASVFGWPAAGRNNFGAWTVESLRQKRPVKLFCDQWISPTLARNAAAMLAELAVKRLSGVWHACGAEVVDRVAFGRRLCEVFGFDEGLLVPVRMSEVELAAPRPARAGLRVEATQAALTDKPLSLDAALKGFLAEYRSTT